VTPTTSLIVLEKIDQYVQYEIEPPISLPKMNEQYWAIMNARKAKKEEKKEEKIHAVLNMWRRHQFPSSPSTS